MFTAPRLSLKMSNQPTKCIKWALVWLYCFIADSLYHHNKNADWDIERHERSLFLSHFPFLYNHFDEPASKYAEAAYLVGVGGNFEGSVLLTRKEEMRREKRAKSSLDEISFVTLGD